MKTSATLVARLVFTYPNQNVSVHPIVLRGRGEGERPSMEQQDVKVALVTDAGGGMGKACALGLARRGWSFFLQHTEWRV